MDAESIGKLCVGYECADSAENVSVISHSCVQDFIQLSHPFEWKTSLLLVTILFCKTLIAKKRFPHQLNVTNLKKKIILDP